MRTELPRAARTTGAVALALVLGFGGIRTVEAQTHRPNAVDSGGGYGIVLAEDAETVTCRDADGKSVVLHKRPRRALVNYTSFIELWYSAGGVSVGMPDTKSKEELPEAARGLPTTGQTYAPNVERILALEPDLVILAANMEKQRALKDILETSGIETLLLAYETYADYVGIQDLFCRVNGDDPTARRATKATEAAVDRIAKRTRALPAPSFLSIFASSRDVRAETDRAHTAFMASFLGARNIVSTRLAPGSATRVTFSLERVHMEDPDVILVTTMGNPDSVRDRMRKDYMESEAWGSLRAVREGRVYFLEEDLFLRKPNARFPEAFRKLADLLYPENR